MRVASLNGGRPTWSVEASSDMRVNETAAGRRPVPFMSKGASMKAYLITTSAVFGLITLAHVWRAVAESSRLAEPLYLLLTALSAGLCLWALYLLRTASRS
jgi:hypothetical protein